MRRGGGDGESKAPVTRRYVAAGQPQPIGEARDVASWRPPPTVFLKTWQGGGFTGPWRYAATCACAYRSTSSVSISLFSIGRAMRAQSSALRRRYFFLNSN